LWDLDARTAYRTAVPRVAFMGSKASGLAALRVLARFVPRHDLVGIVAASDANDDRSVQKEMGAAAAELGVPFVVAATGSDDAALAGWRPDIIVVVGWYRLVALDRHPKTTFYGIHYSRLPAYRGSAPVVWQIIRGEPRIGVTLFRFESGVDNGGIVDQGSVDVATDDTIGDVLPRLDQEAVAILTRRLPDLLAGRVSLRTQNEAEATYCAPRRPSDGEIDWTAPAPRLHDFIRAQSHPYPGAFSWLKGKKVSIWRSQVGSRTWIGVPGTIVAHEDGAALVACGEGAVRVISAQVEDGPEAGGPDVLDRVGSRLGPKTSTLERAGDGPRR